MDKNLFAFRPASYTLGIKTDTNIIITFEQRCLLLIKSE